MGENNGRKSQPSVADIRRENEKLRNAYSDALMHIRQLENTWTLQRAQFLFKMLEVPYFSEDIKKKAADELTEFMFPPEPEVSNQSEENKEAE